MLSHVEHKSSEVLLKTIMLLFAVGLNGVELLLPRIPMLPWLKPGLANTITIIWLIRFGMYDALLFTILRTWISGFYFGFSLLAMTLSLSGGLLSTCIMSLAWITFGKKGALGMVGLGILGALIHNSGQLMAVYLLLTRNNSVFYQIPFMTVAAILFGGLTGILVPTVSNIIPSAGSTLPPDLLPANNLFSYDKKDLLLSTLIIGTCISLFTIPSIAILFAITVVITTLAFILLDHKLKVFLYPLRFKFLFLFIALTYILFSPGKRLTPLSFPTDEGLYNALMQLLRIWSWIEAGLILHTFHFNEILFSMLKNIFPKHQSTLSSGILALEYFPEIISPKKGKTKVDWIKLFNNPALYLKRYFEDLYKRIEVVAMVK